MRLPRAHKDLAGDSWLSSVLIARDFFIGFHLVNDIANFVSSNFKQQPDVADSFSSVENNICMLAKSKLS